LAHGGFENENGADLQAVFMEGRKELILTKRPTAAGCWRLYGRVETQCRRFLHDDFQTHHQGKPLSAAVTAPFAY
jgi:hypothetical protein